MQCFYYLLNTFLESLACELPKVVHVLLAISQLRQGQAQELEDGHLLLSQAEYIYWPRRLPRLYEAIEIQFLGNQYSSFNENSVISLKKKRSRWIAEAYQR